MIKVEVKKEFFDIVEKKDRTVGEVFECTQKRFNEMKKNLAEFCPQCEWVVKLDEREADKTPKA